MLKEYIELDYAGWGGWPRLTHIPSGDTCLKSPYMTWKQWEEKRDSFLNKYPNLIILDRAGREVCREDLT